MQRFKSIILPMQGHAKTDLYHLYNTTTDSQRELIFSYRSLQFWFGGTSIRNSEKLFLFVRVPFSTATADIVPVENCLLSALSPIINDLSKDYVNNAKSTREKAQFEMQTPDSLMLRRSGIHYCPNEHAVTLTIHFHVPLVNALSVNAKAAVRAVRDILEHIENAVTGLNPDLLSEYINCYHKQLQIREYLKSHKLCAFVANGSTLPRENGTAKPMQNAIPFCSPKELEVTIPFADGTAISGMGIRRGVTVITGGGYSGKSTLLDALEGGIYPHIPHDGREYVVTDNTALKIYAEDGRPVHNLDLSPFFRYLPQNQDIRDFSTTHASGSVSQAANIIEAVCGGSTLLLIDEDKSATNFMIRDRNMRKIVKNEPIIPFTDRVRELSQTQGVSTILVIGGSSEYLSCADCVIQMDEYEAKDITEMVRTLGLPAHLPEAEPANWTQERRLLPKQTTQPFLYFRSVETENEKKIILDEYSADITLLTAVSAADQMNTLALVMKRLLTDTEGGELFTKISSITNGMFKEDVLLTDTDYRWYAEIRPLDAFCCVHRMRGNLRFPT